MAVFALLVALFYSSVVRTFLWLNHKPWVALISLCIATTCLVIAFKWGESVPTEYAKFKLGYF